MNKRVYLHIGYYKTGTSSIQHYCDSHKKKLLSHGILYPATGLLAPNGTHGLLSLKRLEEIGEDAPQWFRIKIGKIKHVDTAESIWKRAVREIDASPADRIVISSEAFVKYAANDKTKALIREVCEYLASYDVRIICYIRRQDDYLESWYNQIVKAGHPVPYGCSLKTLEGLGPMQQNFLKTLDAWEEVFGRERMIVRIYDRGMLVGNDVVCDFLHLLSIKEDFGEDGPCGGIQKNVGLSKRLIEIKRRYNYFVDRSGERPRDGSIRINEVLRAVETVQAAWAEEKGPRLLTTEDRRLVLERNEGINREISNRYFNGKWPLFTEIGDDEATVSVAGEPGMKEMLLVLLGMVTKRYLWGHAAVGDMRSLEELLRRIEEIEHSRSWRVTAPLRKASAFFRRRDQ